MEVPKSPVNPSPELCRSSVNPHICLTGAQILWCIYRDSVANPRHILTSTARGALIPVTFPSTGVQHPQYTQGRASGRVVAHGKGVQWG